MNTKVNTYLVVKTFYSSYYCFLRAAENPGQLVCCAAGRLVEGDTT